MRERMRNLIIKRGEVIPFSDLPNDSIALDGMVRGPEIDAERNRFSFDHHENCIRSITLASCQQVYNALKLGLDPSLFDVYINDVDGDTAMAVWLLSNWGPHMENDIWLEKIIKIVGNVDAFGPAHPDAASDTFNIWKQVTKPEADAKYVKKNYETIDLAELVEEIGNNIDKMHAGEYKVTEDEDDSLDYKPLHRGDGWIIVESSGFGIFQHMYGEENRINRVIACTPEDENGKRTVTIGKKSDFVSNFSVPNILAKLNEAEGLGPEVKDRWGGGTTIGGSPRGTDTTPRGTSLSIDKIKEIVTSVIG